MGIASGLENQEAQSLIHIFILAVTTDSITALGKHHKNISGLIITIKGQMNLSIKLIYALFGNVKIHIHSI